MKVVNVSVLIYGTNGVIRANDSFDEVVLVRHVACVCEILLCTVSFRMKLLLRERMINNQV